MIDLRLHLVCICVLWRAAVLFHPVKSSWPWATNVSPIWIQYMVRSRELFSAHIPTGRKWSSSLSEVSSNERKAILRSDCSVFPTLKNKPPEGVYRRSGVLCNEVSGLIETDVSADDGGSSLILRNVHIYLHGHTILLTAMKTSNLIFLHSNHMPFLRVFLVFALHCSVSFEL
jgi:hypothetical protein